MAVIGDRALVRRRCAFCYGCRGHTGKQTDLTDAVIYIQESPPHRRFLVECSSPFMRLAQRLTALRASRKLVSTWSVKTRRALSRHCRGAKVYGHTTTAVHGMGTPPSSALSLSRFYPSLVVPAAHSDYSLVPCPVFFMVLCLIGVIGE